MPYLSMEMYRSRLKLIGSDKMEIDFDKESGITTLKPKKKFPNGYDIEISFGIEYVVFTLVDGGKASNVQIDYDEWYQLKKAFNLVNR